MEFAPTAVRLLRAPGDALIPRERIRAMRIVHDSSASHPFAQFFLGFVLLLLGGLGVLVLVLIGVREALPIAVEDGEIQVQPIPVTWWLAVTLGVWSLVGVFRAGYHLTIETDERVRRTFLGGARDVGDIRQLVRHASWSFGYEIDASVLGDVDAPADGAAGSC